MTLSGPSVGRICLTPSLYPYTLSSAPFHNTGGPFSVQDTPYTNEVGRSFMLAGKELGFDLIDENTNQSIGKELNEAYLQCNFLIILFEKRYFPVSSNHNYSLK